MENLEHFLFFNLKSDLEFKTLKDSFCLCDDNLYKLDVIDNKLVFLSAKNNNKDIEYHNLLDEILDIKNKSIKYTQAILDNKKIECFNNFYICTNLNTNLEEGLKFDEYERLKITLLYGLKSKKFGISIGLALRIYLFYLSANSKIYEIKRIIDMFNFIYHENISKTLLNLDNDLIDNLSYIVLDNENFYTNNKAKEKFSCVFSKILRLHALKMLKSENSDDIIILLDFVDFFKKHKKLDFKEKIIKNKNIKKIAKKISKIAKKYYLG